MGLSVTEAFDVKAMADFMRVPELYWATRDALAPPPECIDFAGHMMQPTVWTVAAMWEQQIIGYVQVVLRTSIMGEVTTAFHPLCRGRFAKVVGEYVIERAFGEKGYAKLVAVVPTDNRRAIVAAKVLGFVVEGRLTKAIVRQPHGLTDLLVFGLCRESWSH